VKLNANLKTLAGDYHTHGDYSMKTPDGKIERLPTSNGDTYNSDKFSPHDDDLGDSIAQQTSKFRAPFEEHYIKVLGTPSGNILVREIE
jgi:hypothetical protein